MSLTQKREFDQARQKLQPAITQPPAPAHGPQPPPVADSGANPVGAAVPQLGPESLDGSPDGSPDGSTDAIAAASSRALDCMVQAESSDAAESLNGLKRLAELSPHAVEEHMERSGGHCGDRVPSLSPLWLSCAVQLLPPLPTACFACSEGPPLLSHFAPLSRRVLAATDSNWHPELALALLRSNEELMKSVSALLPAGPDFG